MIDKIHLKLQTERKSGSIIKKKLYLFFGINIIMAYHQLPALKHYWVNANDMGIKRIETAMGRDCFIYILDKLHLNDNAKLDPNKKENLWKAKACFGKNQQTFLKK